MAEQKIMQNVMLLDIFYPPGSYYETSDPDFDPNVRWGGIWELEDAGRVLQSTQDASKVGTNVDAGLPNLSGNFKLGWADKSGGGIITPNGNSANNNGVFSNYHSGDAFWVGGSYATVSSDNYHANWMKFDASRANSIYGNSDTVQPPATLVKRWHRTA